MNRSLNRWILPALVVISLATVMTVGPEMLQRMAYAVEAGKIQAERERLIELSKQDTLSPLFRAVSSVVQPAVVEMRVTKRVKASPIDSDLEELIRRHFGENSPFGGPLIPMPDIEPREYFAHGLGSGVIVNAEEGYILTNNHVVADADEVEIKLYDGRTVVAEWVRTDSQTDLAVVKIKADGLIDAPLGDSDSVEVGDWVLAIGSPRGLQRTVTAGIVSAKGRQINGPGMYEDSIQTDAAINRGNSGGPLVNMLGEVIGINNTIASSSGGNEGIGFAIPSNMAADVMHQLVTTGSVVRGFLGVMIQDADERLARSFGLPNSDGALVTQIQPDTPAAEAGLQPGDFIVSVDGKLVHNVRELRNEVAAIRPGQTVPLEAYRDGKKMTFEVTVVAQPTSMAVAGEKPQESEPASDYGLKVATLTPSLAERLGIEQDLQGVLITEVSPGSDAAEAGLRTGMVITHVGETPVATAEKFAELLDAAEGQEGVRLRVQTPDGARYVFIGPSNIPDDE